MCKIGAYLTEHFLYHSKYVWLITCHTYIMSWWWEWQRQWWWLHASHILWWCECWRQLQMRAGKRAGEQSRRHRLFWMILGVVLGRRKGRKRLEKDSQRPTCISRRLGLKKGHKKPHNVLSRNQGRVELLIIFFQYKFGGSGNNQWAITEVAISLLLWHDYDGLENWFITDPKNDHLLHWTK